MNKILLSKESSDTQIKQYFEKVLELKKQDENFPVDLDEVWPLVYTHKHKAVKALKDDVMFTEEHDYQCLNQKGESKSGIGGDRRSVKYMLSTSCLEYFIARKVRPVFNVYREVFHRVAEKQALPQTFSEALRLAADQAEQIEQQQKEIEASNPLVNFANTVADSSDTIDMGEFSKLSFPETGLGRTRLFRYLRNNKILDEGNVPYQRYIAAGWFKVIEQPFQTPYGTKINIKTLVTGRGQISIIERIKKDRNEG